MQKNYIKIWDFDGVIVNSEKIYTTEQLIKIYDNNNMVAKMPDASNDYLLTGRSHIDKDIILSILKKHNINFKVIIMSDFNEIDYLRQDIFYYKYLPFKLAHICRIVIYEHEKNNNKVLIIDDTKKIIDICKSVDLKTKHIKKFKNDLTYLK